MIKDNTLIISNYRSKLELLDKLEPFKNVKFFTPSSYFDTTGYTFTDEAFLYMKEELKLDFDLINSLKEAINKVTEENAQTDKLKKLLHIKKHLLANNLIYKESLIQKDLEKRTIYTLDVFDKRLEKFEKLKLERHQKHIFQYSFLTVYDELDYLFKKISDLLKKGVLPEEIKIVKTSDYDDIYLYSRIFNIPITLKDKYLKDTEMGIKISNLLKEKEFNLLDFKEFEKEDIYDFLKGFKNLDSPYLNKFISYQFEKLKLSERVEPAIEIINLKDAFGVKHLFLLGFNEGNYTLNKRDDDYLKDQEKLYLGLNTSKDENNSSNKLVNEVFKNNETIYVSYKLSYNDQTYLKHHLLKEDDEVEELPEVSKDIFVMNLTKALDNFFKYDIKSFYLDYASSTLNSYNTYDNQFKGIVKDEKKRLSYSSLNELNKCNFKYYVKYLLKLDPFEDTFATKIGSLFHLMMEKDLDFDEALKEFEFSDKEMIWALNLKKFFADAQKFNQSFMNKTFFKKIIHEEEINLALKDNYYLQGKIDAIFLDEEKKLFSIVDYKTGNTDVSLKYLNQGINIQLLIYWYLVREKYPGYQFVGAYFQNILNKIFEEERNQTLLLNGFTVLNKDNLERFSPGLNNINHKYNNDGSLSKKSGNLEISQLTEIEEAISKNIDEAIRIKKSGKFLINPIEVVGCKYCEFKDLCFLKKEQEVEVESDEGTKPSD